MTPIKVAFIDDGIALNHIPDGIPFENYTADEAGVRASTPSAEVGHGTMCYQIFRDNIKLPYHLLSIKVLDNSTGTGNHKSLLSALKWCADQDIDLINMSMGTQQFSDFQPIAKAVSELPNTIIVAACANSNNLTFPACLPNVIGVRHYSHFTMKNSYAYIHEPYDQIEILACADDIPIAFNDNHTTVIGSNSFAAPLITARVSVYMSQGHRSHEAVTAMLKAGGVGDTIATYDMYKKMLYNWEDISAPIIFLPEKLHSASDLMHRIDKLKVLVNVFVQDGYRAIALCQGVIASPCDLIYPLDWRHTSILEPARHCEDNNDKVIQQELLSTEKIIELYHNFALPDIIFLQTTIETALALPHDMKPDVVLKPQCMDMQNFGHWKNGYVLDWHQPAENLLLQIKKLLV